MARCSWGSRVCGVSDSRRDCSLDVAGVGGAAMTLINDVKKWATENIGSWSLILLTVLVTAMGITGIVVLVKDVETSYYGWANKLVGIIDMPSGQWFGWVLAIIPTLFQLAFLLSKIVGFQVLSNHKIFGYVATACFVIDNALDVISLMRFGENWAVSLVSALIITLVFFTLCSEFMIALFVPTSITMWGIILSKAFTDRNWSLEMSDLGADLGDT